MVFFNDTQAVVHHPINGQEASMNHDDSINPRLIDIQIMFVNIGKIYPAGDSGSKREI